MSSSQVRPRIREWLTAEQARGATSLGRIHMCCRGRAWTSRGFSVRGAMVGGRGARGLAAIVGGSSFAQLLAFAALPVLSRLYNPEETAFYTLLLSVGLVAFSVSTFRLELAIPIPGDERDSLHLFWMATLAPALVLPVVTLLGILVMELAPTGKVPGVGPIDFASVWAFVFVLAAFSAGSQLAIRQTRYGLLGRIPVWQMIATLAAQVGLGLAGIGRGLFLGGVFGRFFGVLGLARGCGVTARSWPSRSQARTLLIRYWRFPLLFTPAALVNTVGLYVPSLMLPILYGLGPSGLYAMAFRIAIAPSAVFTQAARQVFLGEFARTSTRRDALHIYLRWSALLIAIAVVLVAGMWLVAPALPTILGSEWSGTEELARYAGVIAGAALVGSPVQGVWAIRQRGLAQFAWDVLRLIATAGTIWGLAQGGFSLATTVKGLALVTCATYAVSWLGCLVTAATSSGPADPDDLEASPGPAAL